MSRFTAVQEAIRPPDGEIAVSWTGQGGFSFKTPDGLVLHVDPYLSNVSSRYVGYHRALEAPASAEQWKGNHYFFTHDHRDHLDTDAIPAIARNNPEAVFYGPPSCISRLLELDIAADRLIPLRRGESAAAGDTVVNAVLAIHTDDSVGYVFAFGDVKVYLTGDTVYSDELISLPGGWPDLMMCCINGRLGNMNIADAVRLTSHIQPRIAVPMHVNMFVENTASPEEYVRQTELYGGMTKGFVMEHGAWYLYGRAGGLRKPDILKTGA